MAELVKGPAAQSGKLQKIPLGKLTPSPFVERDFKQYHADRILADFNLDDFGVPVVNHRDGHYYIIDGQHRIYCVREWLGPGNDDQRIECRVFENLTEQQEADMYDRLSTTLAQTSFQKFMNRIKAQRPAELQIYRIVEKERLRLSLDEIPGAIGAVGTLRRVYMRSDAETLARTLRLARDAYGDAGLDARVIDGLGHLCQRYDGVLDETAAIDRLSSANGGVSGLLNKAEQLHRSTGTAKAQCVGAAAVEIINAKRGAKKLPNWWRT